MIDGIRARVRSLIWVHNPWQRAKGSGLLSKAEGLTRTRSRRSSCFLLLFVEAVLAKPSKTLLEIVIGALLDIDKLGV